MKLKRKNTGFTLIELLVVIAIIALLLSILSPGLKKAKDTANRVMCGTRLKQIGVAMKMYSDAFDGSLPDDRNIAGTGRSRHGFIAYRANPNDGGVFVYPNGKLKPLRFAYLHEQNYIEVPEIFYCPGNRHPSYQYKSYTAPGSWGTLPQDYNVNTDNSWVRVGYTYYPIDRAPNIASDGVPVEQATKFIRLNPNLPYASDLLHNLDQLAHQSKAVQYLNGLFPDGHVTFSNDQEIFAHSIWEKAENGLDERGYETFYYTIFRMIRP